MKKKLWIDLLGGPIIMFLAAWIVSMIWPNQFSMNKDSIIALCIATICYWIGIGLNKSKSKKKQ